MDSRGNIYAPAERRPADSVDLPDDAAVALKQMNRRARRVYYSEIRRGASESVALRIAAESYTQEPSR